MVEKRTAARVTPPEGSYVINQVSDAKMGRLVDVSSSGFLLAARENIKPGMIFQLTMCLLDKNSTHIEVGAECIWSDLQVSGLTFAGFQVIDISPSDENQLVEFIELLTAN